MFVCGYRYPHTNIIRISDTATLYIQRIFTIIDKLLFLPVPVRSPSGRTYREAASSNRVFVPESVDDMSSQQGVNWYVFCVLKHSEIRLNFTENQCENCEKNNWGVCKYGVRRRGGGWEGVSPFPNRVRSGEGLCPPIKFFNFLAQNSAFWHLF